MEGRLPQIIYESNDFVAINKPAGLLTHSDKKTEESLVSWFLKHYPEISGVGDDPINRPGIVHRLDRDTSGVILVAKNQPTFEFLKKQFQDHSIRKTYLALVYGAPKEPQGTIDLSIGLKSGTTRRTVHVKNAKLVKPALTRYSLLRSFDLQGQPVSLLKVSPETGRTHQIRIHLKAIGLPIVGDPLYGPKKPMIKSPRLFLHADSIEFTAPTGDRLTLASDLPPELKNFIE
ncbi:MAG: RluA family pseudouridine synthase [Candidatus Harrisonbacteria bacterium]|nr:RluA family pseudouridine synthase [Candidatus Harrisonbacteria bacterium]